MTFEEAALIPSEEELDEIWDFVIHQSEIDSPFGNIVRGIIDYYRHYMDQDKLDRMDLEDLVVSDE